jgi:hypothetical protein
MSARTGGLLSVWVVLILIAPVGYAQSAGTLESPPLDRPEVFFDVAKPDLTVIVPGQVAFRHWQGTVSTAAALQLTKKGSASHAPTVAEQYGGVQMHLLKGKLRVIFEHQELLLKSGDVASWGDLRHRIQCEVKECLLTVISNPVAWRRLGPEDSGPVPLYMDPDYLRKVGVHVGTEK